MRILCLIAACSSCLAQTGLETLAQTLAGLRVTKPGTDGLRGATPQLTVAKHQLRDWVESQLPELSKSGDEAILAKKLNTELAGAHLLCDWAANPCPDWSLLGFASGLRFQRSTPFLILQTGIGIECGFDESVYLYGWSDGGWRRVWQNEQNDYAKGRYKPQSIESVMVGGSSRTNDYIVLTLGREPWCISNWHEAYYRLFRIGGDPEASPLVEGGEWAYWGGSGIYGSVSRDEALVEFRVRSIDGGVHSRAAIRHYRIEANGVRRMEPLALNPRDFVDEWLTHEWREASSWTEPANRAGMRVHHDKDYKDDFAAEFDEPPLHCAAADLWQVGIALRNSEKEEKKVYYLVRWRPPYRFSMVGVGDHPSTACTQEDPEADADRTLFPNSIPFR